MYGLLNDLLHRCCEGDEAAWDDFVERYRGGVKAAVIHTLQRAVRRVDHADVENIVQDVFLSLFEDDRRRLKSFEGRCPLEAWLRSVSIRRSLNYIRDTKRDRTLDPLFAPEAPPPPEPEREEIRRLDEHMNRLSTRERLALRLHYFEGLPQKEIAGILGVSENTIWPMMSRARDKLREFLTE